MSSKEDPEHNRRVHLCMTCTNWNPKGCSLYLKPCTVKELWKDQIEPPTNCPKREKFL